MSGEQPKQEPKPDIYTVSVVINRHRNGGGGGGYEVDGVTIAQFNTEAEARDAMADAESGYDYASEIRRNS